MISITDFVLTNVLEPHNGNPLGLKTHFNTIKCNCLLSQGVLWEIIAYINNITDRLGRDGVQKC